MRAKNTLILFTKSPQICRVKTRMWPQLSHRECLHLHKAAVKSSLRAFSSSLNFNLIVYSTDGVFQNIKTKKQTGTDLGIRMYNAMYGELKCSERVVLIGSDCLQLNVGYINRAFSLLKANKDTVLGPANDGGYVLIGARTITSKVFDDVSWGTNRVMEATIRNLSKHNFNVNLLEPLIDVDTYDDLRELYKKKALPHWALGLLNN